MSDSTRPSNDTTAGVKTGRPTRLERVLLVGPVHVGNDDSRPCSDPGFDYLARSHMHAWLRVLSEDPVPEAELDRLLLADQADLSEPSGASRILQRHADQVRHDDGAVIRARDMSFITSIPAMAGRRFRARAFRAGETTTMGGGEGAPHRP